MFRDLIENLVFDFGPNAPKENPVHASDRNFDAAANKELLLVDDALL
jgi:hypothetical protein